MSQNQDNIAKDFEGIVKKTIEINTQYFKQGSNLVSQLANSRSEKKTINPLQPDLLVDAFTAFAKLNLDHYKNMVDLGFQLSKKIINNNDTTNDNTNEVNDPKTAAFVLEATVKVGGSTSLQFVLDNTKTDEASCTLKNQAFINVGNPNIRTDFKTTFTPQSFLLKSGESQTIKIDIKVGAKVKLGIYQSKVQVLGFESAHFLVKLNVIEKSAKPAKSVKSTKPTKTVANVQTKKRDV